MSVNKAAHRRGTDVQYAILGACRPQLAEQAAAREASIGLLLPCNVVVRADGEQRTLVG